MTQKPKAVMHYAFSYEMALGMEAQSEENLPFFILLPSSIADEEE